MNFRPINRFVAKRVFSGLTTACRLAEMPTSRSPSWAKATTDGVVRAPGEDQRCSTECLASLDHLPSAFSMIRGTFPSITATAEFVVPILQSAIAQSFAQSLKAINNIPRSIPITWPLTFSSPLALVDSYLANDEPTDERNGCAKRGMEVVARGNYEHPRVRQCSGYSGRGC